MGGGGGGPREGGGINIRAIEGTGVGGSAGQEGCVRGEERKGKEEEEEEGGGGVRRGKDLQEDVGKRAEVYERAERRKSVARLWGKSMLSLVTLVL